MISPPFELEGWSRRRIAGGVVFTELRGRACVRIRSRVGRARIEAVAAEVAESHGVGRVTSLDRRRLSCDGELGVLAVGRLEGNRDLALALIGDGPFACVDGVGEIGTDIALLVESLAQRVCLDRGALRVRMFEYSPPYRWRGQRRESSTQWLHPDTPRASARIWVHDARPFSTSLDERLHRWLFLQPEHHGAHGDLDDVESAYGLQGRVVESRVNRLGLVRRGAAFGDDRFLYLLSIEAREGDHLSLDAFDRLLHSVRPLPAATFQSAALACLAD